MKPLVQDEISLKRDDLALQLLCAFNGLDPKLAPPEWWFYPNPNIRDCWRRVAELCLSLAAKETVQ